MATLGARAKHSDTVMTHIAQCNQVAEFVVGIIRSCATSVDMMNNESLRGMAATKLALVPIALKSLQSIRWRLRWSRILASPLCEIFRARLAVDIAGLRLSFPALGTQSLYLELMIALFRPSSAIISAYLATRKAFQGGAFPTTRTQAFLSCCSDVLRSQLSCVFPALGTDAPTKLGRNPTTSSAESLFLSQSVYICPHD